LAVAGSAVAGLTVLLGGAGSAVARLAVLLATAGGSVGETPAEDRVVAGHRHLLEVTGRSVGCRLAPHSVPTTPQVARAFLGFLVSPGGCGTRWGRGTVRGRAP